MDQFRTLASRLAEPRDTAAPAPQPVAEPTAPQPLQDPLLLKAGPSQGPEALRGLQVDLGLQVRGPQMVGPQALEGDQDDVGLFMPRSTLFSSSGSTGNGAAAEQ